MEQHLLRGTRVHLYTPWGTFLCYDEVSGLLLQGRPGEIRPNLALLTLATQTSLRGVLIHYDETIEPRLLGWDEHFSPYRLDDQALSLDDKHSFCFDVGILGRDQISLRLRNSFLSAEGDASTITWKPWRRAWEVFTTAQFKRSDKLAGAPLSTSVRRSLDQLRRRNTDPLQRRLGTGSGKYAVLCSYEWLKTFIAAEHYHFVRLLHETFGFDIIDTSKLDFSDLFVEEALEAYQLLFIAWQGNTRIPLNRLSTFKILKIDDLENYDPDYTDLLRFFCSHSDMLVGPYAYEMNNYFPHEHIEWLPYSSAVEAVAGPLAFNDDPIPQVLLSGSVAWDRPFRQFVFELDDSRLAKIAHPGYGGKYDEHSPAIVQQRWYAELNRYLCGFCDAHSLRYIHLRVFEIASVGALLLADRLVEREMNQLGFVEGETCVFTDAQDFGAKVDWILAPENRSKVDAIRASGMKLVLEHHTTEIRVRDFVALLRSKFGLSIEA